MLLPRHADTDRLPSGIEIKFDVPKIPRITLAELLESGIAVLNGPDHPIPSLNCYCLAPDAATYDTTQLTGDNETGAVTGRVFEEDGAIVRDEMLAEPEEIKAGELVLFPEET